MVSVIYNYVIFFVFWKFSKSLVDNDEIRGITRNPQFKIKLRQSAAGSPSIVHNLVFIERSLFILVFYRTYKVNTHCI